MSTRNKTPGAKRSPLDEAQGSMHAAGKRFWDKQALPPPAAVSAITIGRISVGHSALRGAPPTISAGFLNAAGVLVGPKNPYESWTVFPILVDGKEVIALSRADARRFAQALLHEVE